MWRIARHGIGNGIIAAAATVIMWMIVLPILRHYGVVTLPLVLGVSKFG